MSIDSMKFHIILDGYKLSYSRNIHFKECN